MYYRVYEVPPYKHRTHKSTINTFGHIDIITRSPPRTVLAFFGIDSNRLCRARRLAELTCNTSFFSTRITAERMLPPEAGGEVSFLVRVINRDLRLERHLAGEPKGTPYFGHEEDFSRPFEDIIPRCLRF